MVTCSGCGEANPDRARFCLTCGSALADRSPPTEELKVVSVLFVDLVGFTASSDRADPEDVQARLRPYHSRVKEEIERFGGTVEKFVGDAVMAVFGAPVAHEDDAERAVRAGLRVLDSIEELNEGTPSLELAVRAAVDTGAAVVAIGARPHRGEGFVTGDVVNMAARLQQSAPSGGLVVGEVTYRATRAKIEYQELDAVVVKGKAAPLPVWRAVAARSRFGVDLDAGRAPFVGREDELALLRQTFERTLRESRLQLVTVVGEPGAGKTRLVAEFRRRVDDCPELVAWRQGRCLPYGDGITFWALGEIVKAQAGILESDSPRQAERKLATVLPRAASGERAWLLSRLRPLVGGDSSAVGRSESFAAWRAFLEGLAEQTPLVLVFEDLHWADAALVEFLDHLVDWSTDVPLLVLCTARPELFERHAAWGGGKRNSTTLTVPPLSEEEMARLIAALLARPVLPPGTQAALLERASGNPLYAEEFARMVNDGDLGGEIDVPETIQSLIAARIDTLPPERKGVLQDASVHGKVFWSGALEPMGPRTPDDLAEALQHLARRELIRRSRTSSIEGEIEYSFSHVLVRDVAYAQIPRAERARKHRAAAVWIEQMAGERVSDQAEILAHHYAEALELAHASGLRDEVAQLIEPAQRFLTLAGDRAAELDVHRARRYYRRALQLLPPDELGRGRLLAKIAERTDQLGRPSEAEAEYEEAIAVLRAEGDIVGAGEALTHFCYALWGAGQTARSRAAIDEAIEFLRQAPPGRELARATMQKAGNVIFGGDAAEGLGWAEEALSMAEALAMTPEIVRSHQLVGMAKSELGDQSGGIVELRESLRVALEHGLGLEAVRAYTNLADQVWFIDGPGPALELLEASIALAERRGLLRQALWSRAESLWMRYDLGDWDELLRDADRIVEAEGMGGYGQMGVIALSYSAQVLAWRGELDRAEAMVEDFLPRAREIDDPQVIFPCLATAALVRSERADQAAALELLDEVRRRVRAGHDLRWARSALDNHRVCLRAGATSLLESLIERSRPTEARRRCLYDAARAALAEIRGDLEAAAALYAAAAEGWKAYGSVPEQAQALLGLGRCSGSEAALQAAAALFASLGAASFIEESERLLNQLSPA
jgi:class 3 adenylate cyclase/tetratricopeptide (TPR) repeat protein